MIARDDRLRRGSDFERARSRGRSWPGRSVVLVVLANELGRNRYGVAAGKRMGNAVARNRAKRLMREVVRELHPRLAPGHDLVLIARNSFSGEMTLAELAGQITTLVERAGLLRKAEEPA